MMTVSNRFKDLWFLKYFYCGIVTFIVFFFLDAAVFVESQDNVVTRLYLREWTDGYFWKRVVIT